MAFREIGSAEAKYLAASDILIGDMSNTNYEFLLYDRPVILLANTWVWRYFPDIGLKTALGGLRSAIERSLQLPDEYKDARRFWLNMTIDQPHGTSASSRYIDIVLERAGPGDHRFVLLHGNDAVRETNLLPLKAELDRRGIPCQLIGHTDEGLGCVAGGCIYIGAHFYDLFIEAPGLKVHIDHDLKGRATANLLVAVRDYKRHGYFPNIDLHIAAGRAGDMRTRFVLGPLADRTAIGGYPKADDFLRLNTVDNKRSVYDELGLDPGLPLVAYAPAGKRSYMKPGGSLCPQVIDHLERISRGAQYHVLVKRKHTPDEVGIRVSTEVKEALRTLSDWWKLAVLPDCGPTWDKLFDDTSDVPQHGPTTIAGR